MPERTYLSIGDVLASLKDEFDDITISKIRFLESQGLIDPERTPSGYRKFYDHDVARLRWILRQQKDHFLPLKVIKDRLAQGDVDPDDATPAGPRGPVPAPSQPALVEVDVPAAASVPEAPPVKPDVVPEPAAEPEPEAEPEPPPAPRPPEPVALAAPPPPPAQLPAAPPTGASAPARRPAPPFPASLRRTVAAPADGAGNGRSRATLAGFLTAPEPASRRVRVSPRPEPEPEPEPVEPDPLEGLTASELRHIELTLDELCAAAGVTPAAVADLERFGLLTGATGRLGRSYGVDDLEVARIAASFAEFGVEARHLRIWKTATEREVAFIEQVVTPLLKQRSPNARREANDALAELAGLAERLHGSLLRAALGAP